MACDQRLSPWRSPPTHRCLRHDLCQHQHRQYYRHSRFPDRSNPNIYWYLFTGNCYRRHTIYQKNPRPILWEPYWRQHSHSHSCLGYFIIVLTLYCLQTHGPLHISIPSRNSPLHSRTDPRRNRIAHHWYYARHLVHFFYPRQRLS